MLSSHICMYTTKVKVRNANIQEDRDSWGAEYVKFSGIWPKPWKFIPTWKQSYIFKFCIFDSGNWLSGKQVCVVPIVGSCPQPTHLLTPGDLHHDRTRLPYDTDHTDDGIMMMIIVSKMSTSCPIWNSSIYHIFILTILLSWLSLNL